MKKSAYLFVLLVLFCIPASGQEFREIDTLIVPLGYETSSGNGIFVGPFGNTPRTYQLLIHQNQLTSLAGLNLTGFTFRLPAAATTPWPDSETTYSNYDIYLSGSVDPSQRSLTFASNIVGPQTKVRSGPLKISIGAFPSGGSPNLFGSTLSFDTAWLYSGGHLLIEIRHTGSNGTSRSVDALTSSAGGYLSNFSACWVGSYTGTSGSQGNFGILRLTAEDPVPVELVSFSASAVENTVELKWITSTELNNYGFDIERRSSDQWDKIGFVPGAVTTTEPVNYSFRDYNLVSGKYSYRLKQTDLDGTYKYSFETEVEVNTITSYYLDQNYPNPFNPVTVIQFGLKEKGNVRLSIFNSLGEEVTVLLNEEKESGVHNIRFDASGFNSGVYYCRLVSGNYLDVKKMMLLK